jgi:hypothetical protein
MRLSRFGLLLFAVVHGAAAIAQKPPPACSLLQASEIDGAVGTKVRPGDETDTVIPNGPAKGQAMTSCMWGISERGMVSVSVIPASSKEQRDGALAIFHQAGEAMKAQGWTIDTTVVGGISCGTMVPPQKESEHMPVAVGCMGEAKGMAMSVSAMIAKTRVAPQKVKAPFDVAVARLP